MRQKEERRTSGVYTSVAGQVEVTAETKGNRADSDGSVTKPQTDLWAQGPWWEQHWGILQHKIHSRPNASNELGLTSGLIMWLIKKDKSVCCEWLHSKPVVLTSLWLHPTASTIFLRILCLSALTHTWHASHSRPFYKPLYWAGYLSCTACSTTTPASTCRLCRGNIFNCHSPISHVNISAGSDEVRAWTPNSNYDLLCNKHFKRELPDWNIYKP